MFENADGGCGVIGGPHEVFTAIESHFNLTNNHQSTFFSNQLSMYRNGYQINPDVSLIGYKAAAYDFNDHPGEEYNTYTSRTIKRFIEAEDTGSQITYICINCRTCKKCKDHDQIETISIKEEIEQDVINKSVTVNIQNRETIATLPFMHDPKIKLAPNQKNAMKVYQQQVKKLNKNPVDEESVIASERKLQDLGHVDYVKYLPEGIQEHLRKNEIQNYIPWRAVWKDSSITTPCRIVFDASQATSTGYSLNDLLAKGKNNMNRLQDIMIRWSTHRVGFHTDIQKCTTR